MAEETWAMIGMVFTALGGVVAGCAGLLLPKQRRLGVVYSITVGFGVGSTVLAIGTVIPGYGLSLFVFFLAGFLGFLSVCLSVWFVATSKTWSDGRE